MVGECERRLGCAELCDEPVDEDVLLLRVVPAAERLLFDCGAERIVGCSALAQEERQGVGSPRVAGASRSMAAMRWWTSSQESKFWTLMLRRAASHAGGTEIPAAADLS